MGVSDHRSASCRIASKLHVETSLSCLKIHRRFPKSAADSALFTWRAVLSSYRLRPDRNAWHTRVRASGHRCSVIRALWIWDASRATGCSCDSSSPEAVLRGKWERQLAVCALGFTRSSTESSVQASERQRRCQCDTDRRATRCPAI